MPRYHTVLLDADNTLFDFSRSEHEAILQTMAAFKIDPTEENARLYSRINDGLWQRFNRGEVTQPFLQTERFRRLCAATGCDADPACVNLCYRAELGKRGYLLPGAEQLCRNLYGKVRMALVTNGSAETQRARFAHSPVTPLFEGHVYISGEMGVQKPMPAYFEAVFADLGLSGPAGVVILGDSLTSDIQGGLNMGIDTVWYNPKNKPAKADIPAVFTVSTLQQAEELILR